MRVGVLAVPGILVGACDDPAADGLDERSAACGESDLPYAVLNTSAYARGAIAGDVDGDGILDAVLGMPAAGRGGFVVEHALEMSGLRQQIPATLGDLDGDGLADFAIGAPRIHADEGRVYVVHGRTETTPVDLGAVEAGVGGFVVAPASGSEGAFPRSIAGARDVDGDGTPDLAIGSSGDLGPAYVVFAGEVDGIVLLDDVAAGSGGFAINGGSQTRRTTRGSA